MSSSYPSSRSTQVDNAFVIEAVHIAASNISLHSLDVLAIVKSS